MMASIQPQGTLGRIEHHARDGNWHRTTIYTQAVAMSEGSQRTAKAMRLLRLEPHLARQNRCGKTLQPPAA